MRKMAALLRKMSDETVDASVRWRDEATNRLLVGYVGRPLQQEESTMLVLSRKKQEQIVINEDIFVTVVDIRGDKVRLGVDAPKDVPVHRKEVHTAIKREEARTQSSGESESTCSP